MVAQTTRVYYNKTPSASQRFGAGRPGHYHRGTDFAHGYGTLVPALITGKVVTKNVPANWHGFGYQVVTEGTGPDGRRYRVSYAHGSRPQNVWIGQVVPQGNYISTEGTTGATSGVCMHLEVFDIARAVFIDPMILVKMVLNDTGVPAGGVNVKPDALTLAVQRSLNKLGWKLVEDGIKGPKTTDAIKQFQRRYGLVADGIWGPKTDAKYHALTKVKRPTIKLGARGEHVKVLQRKLGGLTADGIFGQKTKNAVVAYQKRNKLVPDGIVGPKTWAKLGL